MRNIPSSCFTRPAVFKANHIVTKVDVPNHTCDNLSMTMLEILFSFSGDCVLLPGDCSTASLTYHFEVFFSKIKNEN